MHQSRNWLFAVLSLALVPQLASAQDKVVLQEGFEAIAPSFGTGEERQAQPDLWIFEVRVKQLRMLEIPITDPKTGTKKPELIYYLVYNAINRKIEARTDETNTIPVNDYDRDPVPDLFVPEIILTTQDAPPTGVDPASWKNPSYMDTVIPEALAAIQRREGRRLQHAVELVQKIPEAYEANDLEATGLFGVAIFRGVDPETDYFRVSMSGFSNGYKLVNGPADYTQLSTLAESKLLRVNDQLRLVATNGEWFAAARFENLFDPNDPPPPGVENDQWFYTLAADKADETAIVWRKTILIDYWRPGDALDQNEREIRRRSEPRWEFVPDNTPVDSEAVETASTK